MSSNVHIVYGTKRGVTGKMARNISDILSKHLISVDIKNVFEEKPGNLINYKINILGSSTWSDGDLQVDFLEFERGMDDIDLTGTYCAVFGPGSSRFPHFCEAVEILQSKLISCGASLLLPSLKVDELGGRTEAETAAWAEKLSNAIKGIS